MARKISFHQCTFILAAVFCLEVVYTGSSPGMSRFTVVFFLFICNQCVGDMCERSLLLQEILAVAFTVLPVRSHALLPILGPALGPETFLGCSGVQPGSVTLF